MRDNNGAGTAMRRTHWLVLLFVPLAAAIALLLFAPTDSPHVHGMTIIETDQARGSRVPLNHTVPEPLSQVAPTEGGAQKSGTPITVDPEVEIDLDAAKARQGILTGPLAAEGVKLEGQVLDEGGEPVPTASVFVSGAVSSDKYRKRVDTMTEIARTDNAGNFSGSYTGLTSTAFTIELFARAGSLDSDRQQLEVAQGSVVSNIVITLALGGGVSGQIVDEHRNPVPMAMVLLVPAEGGITIGTRVHRSTSGARGDYLVKGLPTGTYRVLVYADGYEDTEAMASVVSGQTTLQSDIMLKATTGLRLRLTCLAKHPVGTFEVIFFDGSGQQTSGGGDVSDDGNALVGNVPDAAVEIEIRMAGYKASERIEITPILGVHVDIGDIELEPEAVQTSRSVS